MEDAEPFRSPLNDSRAKGMLFTEVLLGLLQDLNFPFQVLDSLFQFRIG